MSTQKRLLKLNDQSSGFVSILVCVTIMIILSLITIGFARLMQREARQALDRQLSTQAFYAAESGVNDAIAIAKHFPTEEKTDCLTNNPGSPYNNLNPDLDGTNNVAYTCLLVNPAPGTLVYDEIGVDRSTVTKLQAEPGQHFNRISISWQSSDPNHVDNFRGNGAMVLPRTTEWNETTGVLRVSLYPVPLNGDVPAPGNRATLAAQARTYFLYPQEDTGGAPGAPNTINYNGVDTDGSIVSGKCSDTRTPRRCTVELNVSSLGSGYMYYMRLRSIYNKVGAEISAYEGSNQRNLVGAQIMVDSTGKTSDVFRRIQVRIPTQKYFDLPEYAIETADDICKRITVAPNFMNDECDPNGPPPGGGTITLPPPTPPIPPPPAGTTCSWTTINSTINTSSFANFSNPTPSGDPAGAAAIVNGFWQSPNTAVFLSGLSCASGATMSVDIGTSGAWGSPPDTVEVRLRRKSDRSTIGTPIIRINNLGGGYQTLTWNISGYNPSDLELIVLLDGANNTSKQPEFGHIRPARVR